MNARSVDRRRQVAAGILAVGLTLLGLWLGPLVQERYAFAWDRGEVPCLPYRTFVIDKADRSVGRGDLVSFRTHGLSAKFRPGSIFTKKVAGVPGDLVVVTRNAVRVNDGGSYGPLYEKTLSRLGRPASSFERTFVLGEGQFFLVGTEPNSFDSRFYGPVDEKYFVGQTVGIW